MMFENPPDETVKELLTQSKTIAVVGLSTKEIRPSYQVAKYLQDMGFQVFPVNPAAREILGEKVYPGLADIPVDIDIVDVFRRSEHVPDIAKAAIDIGAKALWLQEGVIHDESAHLAQKSGLTVLQDICIKKVGLRLL